MDGKRSRLTLWMRRGVGALVLWGAFLGLPLAFASSALADNWHRREGLSCGNCHGQHETRGLRKGPFLLRERSTVSLCLRCHGGTSPQAANVLAPPAGPSRDGVAGGGFQKGRGMSHGTHPLELPATLPGIGEITLTCITCHDPHGNTNFRDLRPDPRANPRERGFNGVGTPVIAREREANERGRGRYEAKNILYREGISRWCQRCHADLYRELGNRGTRHHPVDIVIEGAGNGRLEPLPLFSSQAPLPVEDPQGDTIYGPNPSRMADDRVSCLTCHYAHGSANPKALRYADGFSWESTCRQCHPQGRGGSGGAEELGSKGAGEPLKLKKKERKKEPWRGRDPIMRGPIR